MSKNHTIKSSTSTQVNAKACEITPATRQQIGASAFSGKESITSLSQQHETSRKFVYAQKEKASSALDDAFLDNKKNSDVLFYIPVTKKWLQQVVLSLVLICHSSYGGIIEFFRDIFDLNICKGTIFNILQESLTKGRLINNSQDLSSIKIGAHDEIFQGRVPVLVGCDVESTYTYLLKQVEHRDTTTWGVHLLELSDQGMKLKHTIADGGKGLRSGQREAWPDVPCHGDVFHPLYDIGKVTIFLENRARATIEVVKKLEVKMKSAKKKNRGSKLSAQLGYARKEARAANQLYSDISIMSTWLKKDILSLTGGNLTSRKELLQFIIDELASREKQLPYRIKPIRRLLEIQGEDLLRFVESIDAKLQNLSNTYHVSISMVYQVFELQRLSKNENLYWEQAIDLYSKLGSRFYILQKSIQNISTETVRASSIVENINSR